MWRNIRQRVTGRDGRQGSAASYLINQSSDTPSVGALRILLLFLTTLLRHLRGPAREGTLRLGGHQP